MKLALPLILTCSLAMSAAALAQTQSAPTKPTPDKSASTKPAPRSANPEDPYTATTGGADKQAFQTGKKLDNSAGCSTPTDAKSAGIDTSKDSAVHNRSDGTRTVCTTSGAEGVGAIDKSKKTEEQRKAASAPSSSTSAKPR